MLVPSDVRKSLLPLIRLGSPPAVELWGDLWTNQQPLIRMGSPPAFCLLAAPFADAQGQALGLPLGAVADGLYSFSRTGTSALQEAIQDPKTSSGWLCASCPSCCVYNRPAMVAVVLQACMHTLAEWENGSQ